MRYGGWLNGRRQGSGRRRTAGAPRAAAAERLGHELLVTERCAAHLAGEVGASVEAGQRLLDARQIALDAIEEDRALVIGHRRRGYLDQPCEDSTAKWRS